MKILLIFIFLIPNSVFSSEEDELTYNDLQKIFGEDIKTDETCIFLDTEIREMSEELNYKIKIILEDILINNKDLEQNDISTLANYITIYNHHNCAENLMWKKLIKDINE